VSTDPALLKSTLTTLETTCSAISLPSMNTDALGRLA
jgi:hypothetical protein